MDFGDFMESASAISTGIPIQSCSGQFFPRKRTFQRRLKKFELDFLYFSPLSSRFGVVEITRCGDNQQNIVTITKMLKSMIFVNFHDFIKYDSTI